jgi:hypothetical protein
MVKRKNKTSIPFDDMPDTTEDKRSGLDRRRESCEGFTYVSTVGWICRREQFRRKDENDTDHFPEGPN